ncbi:MAG TPA: acyl-CoA thioesterase [Kofleriaceae bacterium]|nr:acyl-CoA thioesterase [Kofleriaceae bacterium]
MTDRFRFPIIATPADIDELGHVSNLVYLRWVLETATAHSAALGWGHAEYLASGNVWVVRRHEIDYLAQVTVGQQLVGETWVDPWKAASCVRRTELIRQGDDVVVARAATTWAFMSIASGRPQRIPEDLKALFS